MTAHGYHGWRRDIPDYRDHAYAAPEVVLRELPAKVDLSAGCPEVYSQGLLGACTSCAINGAHQFLQCKQGAVPFRPSRLFIYFGEREIEGTVDEDGGAMIRTGMKVVAEQGVCPETMWPYDIARFRTKPDDGCYVEALNHQVILYQRVPQTLNQLKGCLADGYPFVCGFTVYEGYESESTTRTGVVNMPRTGERCLGGHAVFVYAYDDGRQCFAFRNSYSEAWGDRGNGSLPFSYLLDPGLAADFWTMRLVET